MADTDSSANAFMIVSASRPETVRTVMSAAQTSRLLGAARVGGDRDDPRTREAEVAEVLREERQRRHVVDRDVEEPLDLARVQVHGQDSVCSRELEHVGDEPAGDRLARLRLAVLA